MPSISDFFCCFSHTNSRQYNPIDNPTKSRLSSECNSSTSFNLSLHNIFHSFSQKLMNSQSTSENSILSQPEHKYNESLDISLRRPMSKGDALDIYKSTIFGTMALKNSKVPEKLTARRVLVISKSEGNLPNFPMRNFPAREHIERPLRSKSMGDLPIFLDETSSEKETPFLY